MKIINKISLIYFVAVLPITLIVNCLVPEVMHSSTADGSPILEQANVFFGFMCGTWVINAFYIGVSLLVSPNYRENLLKKLTGIQERDEREELIVAKAARSTFLFNLGVMTFLLLLGTIQIKYEELPTAQQVDGRKNHLSLGLRFDPWDNKADSVAPSGPRVIYENKIPLTASGVLMVLILSQLGSYYFYACRQKVIC